MNAALIIEEPDGIMVPNQLRSCTDVLCAILLFLFIGAFVGLLIYGIITGDFSEIVSVHNSDGVRCDQNPTYPCN